MSSAIGTTRDDFRFLLRNYSLVEFWSDGREQASTQNGRDRKREHYAHIAYKDYILHWLAGRGRISTPPQPPPLPMRSTISAISSASTASEAAMSKNPLRIVFYARSARSPRAHLPSADRHNRHRPVAYRASILQYEHKPRDRFRARCGDRTRTRSTIDATLTMRSLNCRSCVRCVVSLWG